MILKSIIYFDTTCTICRVILGICLYVMTDGLWCDNLHVQSMYVVNIVLTIKVISGLSAPNHEMNVRITWFSTIKK